MEPTPIILVPATSGVIYALLYALIRRRGRGSAGIAEFQLLLALLSASSILSVLWRLTQESPTGDALLRLLAFVDLAVAPTYLAFVSTRYASQWTKTIRFILPAVAANAGIATLSGAMNRALLTPGVGGGFLDTAVAYGAVLASLTAYLAAAAYVIRAHRVERDPFERNRLKYLTIASLLIIAGQLTNLMPVLQKLPVDRGLAVVASSLVFYSVMRYRLFDIDVAFKRSLVSLVPLGLVAPLYLVALFAIGSGRESLLSPFMFTVGVALLLPGALLAHVIFQITKSLIDRLFLGRHLEAEAAGNRFVAEGRQLRSTAALARLTAEVCQAALESRFAAVMITHAPTGTLETTHVIGPFAHLYSLAPITTADPLVKAVLSEEMPVTYGRLQQLATNHGVTAADFEKFEHLRDCVIQPIHGHEDVIGLIVVGPRVYEGAFSISDVSLLSFIAGQAGLNLENARMFEQMREASNTDFLTGLPNHRHLQELLSSALNRAKEEGTALSVAMIDVDNFKLLNDTYGHIAGDEALKTIAQLLRGGLSGEQVVGRYGGDEFLFILPELPRDQGADLLTRIVRDTRRIVFNLDLPGTAARERLPLRISWGLATYPADADLPRTLVASADSELLKRRYVRRRAGTVSAARPSLQAWSEEDPRRVRIASGLLDLLDAKDPYTTEHSQQVASLALLMAEELRLPEAQRQVLWLGGLLHDVGKLNIPEDILRKPGNLTDAEWNEVRVHPSTGRILITGLFGTGELSEIVACHHERFDGSGYPAGLAGEAIPRLARAISVADAYSAMVHDRPYRKGLSSEAAIRILEVGAGSQWDPEMVGAFVRAIGPKRPQSPAQMRVAV